MNYILLLAAAGRVVLPGDEAAPDDPKNTAYPADREEGGGLSNTTLSTLALSCPPRDPSV